MAAQSDQRLIRITKFVVDLIYYLLVGASIFLGLWILLSPLVLKVFEIPITASFLVGIGTGPESQFPVEITGKGASEIRDAYVSGAQGTLRMETTNWLFIAFSNIANLITAAGLVYVFYQLRAILEAIRQGDPFTRDNVTHMRRMGWAILAIGFLRPTVEYLATREMLNQLSITAPPLGLPSPFESVVILASLLILILAQVWSYGLEIERDRALTI